MMLSTKVGKILSRQKSPDRYTLVSLFQPKLPQDRSRGLLYFVIEVLSPDPALARIAKQIESMVIEEYYADFTSGIEALEKSLKSVNQMLSRMADEGEVGWIGKLGGVIAAVEQNTLHISQTGNVEAYLIRDERISHITEHMGTDKPAPQHTFANVASGSLRVQDKILISTSELFYHFSIDDLRRIIAKFSPAAAASYIVKSLHREEVESINTLVLECVPDEDNRDEAGGATEWIGPQPTTIEEYAEKVTPALGFLKNISQKGLDKSKMIYQEQIAVTVSKISQEANKKVNERLAQYQQPQSQADETANLFTPLSDRSDNRLIATGRSLLHTIRSSVSASKERSQIFIIGSIVLILVLVASGSYSFQNKRALEKRDGVQKQYEMVRMKTDGALKAQKLGDDKKARELLIEAQHEIAPLLSEKYFVSDITELANTIDDTVEQLFNIQRYAELPTLTDFATFDSSVKVSGIFMSPAGLITFDRERKNLLRYNAELQTVEKVGAAYFDGTYQAFAENDDGTIVFATHNPNSIYAINLASLDIKKSEQISGDTWPKATALATYFKNLYTLVPSEGQIYKHINLIGNFGAKTPYITDAGGIDMGRAVDIAIDGAVYVLMNDGAIHQFQSGVKSAWQISGLPILNDKKDRTKTGVSQLLQPTKMKIDPSTGNLIVIDAGARRLVVFNTEGVYQKQYVSDLFTEINDFWIDSPTNQILILSGSKVYQVPL